MFQTTNQLRQSAQFRPRLRQSKLIPKLSEQARLQPVAQGGAAVRTAAQVVHLVHSNNSDVYGCLWMFMVDILEVVHGLYKPTLKWGPPPCSCEILSAQSKDLEIVSVELALSNFLQGSGSKKHQVSPCFRKKFGMMNRNCAINPMPYTIPLKESLGLILIIISAAKNKP